MVNELEFEVESIEQRERKAYSYSFNVGDGWEDVDLITIDGKHLTAERMSGRIYPDEYEVENGILKITMSQP